MVQTHPRAEADKDLLVACIEACYDCAQACISCADACLGEPDVTDLIRCIRINQDCAVICEATGTILSRMTESDWNLISMQVAACEAAAGICAAECEMHAGHMEHCRICAEVCRRCQDACRLLRQM
jgi:hypothetical protein